MSREVGRVNFMLVPSDSPANSSGGMGACAQTVGELARSDCFTHLLGSCPAGEQHGVPPTAQSARLARHLGATHLPLRQVEPWAHLTPQRPHCGGGAGRGCVAQPTGQPNQVG